MNASLIARLASLLLLIALLVPSSPAAAADRSPYVRAAAKGRVVVHRPNYKQYKGSRTRSHGAIYRLFHR